MRNIIKISSLILFLSLSMFYTNKSIDVLRNQDPIMKQIKSTNDKYKIDPIDAVINGDEMSSGTYGKEIDYESSYNRMKRYGEYNEALTVLKESKPTISIEDNYDKYLVKGNSKKRSISLVFIMNKYKDISDLITLLEKKDVQATFFVDGTILEKRQDMIRNLSNHEIEILSYDNEIEEVLFETSISYLESLTNREARFCYTEYDDEKLLKICSKNKLHTIKPSIIIEKDIYQTIKKEVESNQVIGVNSYKLNDLSYSIDYLKSKGYNLVTVSDLFKEQITS